jgi:hypothetical protein
MRPQRIHIRALPYSRAPLSVRLAEAFEGVNWPVFDWGVVLAIVLPALWAVGELWAGR